MSDDELPEILDCNDTVVDRYEVICRIGDGGMSQVYKVLDLQSGIDVALKICHPDADHVRFAREVDLMRRVTDPHVMRILDHGTHAGYSFLIMPYAEQCLKNLRFDLTEQQEIEDVLAIFLEVCEGVRAIHAQGIVHRDIKPHNILQVDGVWVVADLGLSKNLKRLGTTLTKTGVVLGTAIYMSPEQLGGDLKLVGESSDIYQLGLVFYQLLTGDVPMRFDPSDILVVELRNIFLRCVKTKQENRYKSVGDLIADLKGLIGAYTGDVEDGPDSVSWLDSRFFAETCRVEIRPSYASVRASERWEFVVGAVHGHWQLLFSRFDQAFRLGAIPPGCKAGQGVNGFAVKSSTDGAVLFSDEEKEVILWLSLRRVVLAAVVKYSSLARRDTDALLVLFLNFIKPADRTIEFLRQQGWRKHVTRMRPFFTRIGIRPTELAGGVNAVSTLGDYERAWLETCEIVEASLPSWWIDEVGLTKNER